MSRRNFPRLLAAGLLAAAASPVSAQWLDTRERVDSAPAPRPVAEYRVTVGQGVRIAVSPLGDKPVPPPVERAEMLRGLIQLGAQLDTPAWPPSPYDQPVWSPPSVTLPNPRYLEVQPQPVVLPVATPIRPVSAAPLGQWHRTVGAMTYDIVVKDTHLTITTKATADVGGKKVSQGMVLTCDYHVTRDGSNLVGLVTGVDAVVEGLTEGMAPDELPKMVTKLQKVLTDKPFAVSFRLYENTLVIGNVRMPACDDADLTTALESVGGRYSPVSEFARPVPPKPSRPASPPPIVPATGISPKARGANSYSPDPNKRIQRLLEQTESPRPAGNEWRDFWFPRNPRPLTPERIHGGII